MLIKGPIVYAFLLPAIVAFAWRARVTGEAVTAWCGWWPWLASLAIFLAWAIGGILFVPEFSEHVVMREFVGRFSEAMHRSQPIYFYLPHLLHRFAPWSILLIVLPLLGGQRARPRNSGQAARDVTGNILARRLEPRGVARDVLRSVQADRSRISGRAAALFAPGRSGGRVSKEGKIENGDRMVLQDRDRNCVLVYDGLRGRENCCAGIASIPMRLPHSDMRSGRKRRLTVGATRWSAAKTRGCCSTCVRPNSSSPIRRRPNGTAANWTAWLCPTTN